MKKIITTAFILISSFLMCTSCHMLDTEGTFTFSYGATYNMASDDEKRDEAIMDYIKSAMNVESFSFEGEMSDCEAKAIEKFQQDIQVLDANTILSYLKAGQTDSYGQEYDEYFCLTLAMSGEDISNYTICYTTWRAADSTGGSTE